MSRYIPLFLLKKSRFFCNREQIHFLQSQVSNIGQTLGSDLNQTLGSDLNDHSNSVFQEKKAQFNLRKRKADFRGRSFHYRKKNTTLRDLFKNIKEL